MEAKKIKKGVHPHGYKELANAKEIESFGQPDEVLIPVAQHIGAPAKTIVEVGDKVKVGQKIAEKAGFISANIHSSIAGEVIEICETEAGQAIRIKNDGSNQVEKLDSAKDYTEFSVEELVQIVEEAGIVGLGGATFPTNVKMSIPDDKEVETIILNGAECEPYLTIDHRMMVEQAEEVVYGLKAIMKMTDANKAYIGIELNKPDAIAKMEEVVADESNIEVAPLEVMYPQGGEKQMIQAILDKEVPSGGLPLDIGVVVNNIGTALAIKEAVKDGKPLYQRGVTVTGQAIKNPGNYIVPVGTSIKELIEKAGGFSEEPGKIVQGGPMTGKAEKNLDSPVLKGTSGIIALTKDQVSDYEAGPCIRCAKCVDHCPARLMPTTLSDLAQKKMAEELDNYNVLDCIECGCCTYTCPAKIELLDWIKLGKQEVTAMKRENE